MIPRRRRLARPTRVTTVVGVTLALLTACGDSGDDAGDDLTEFRQRAQTAAAGSWSAVYALERVTDTASPTTVSPTPSPDQRADLSVAHRPDALRLDITTPQTTTTFIATDDGTVACQATGRAAPECLQAAGPGQTPPPALDPGLGTVLDDGLARLGEGFGTVEIVPTGEGVDAGAICARVTGEDVPAGVYCLLPNGVPAAIQYPSGSTTLTSEGQAPEDPAFVPPATPKPL